jgi:hypothetical protein
MVHNHPKLPLGGQARNNILTQTGGDQGAIFGEGR